MTYSCGKTVVPSGGPGRLPPTARFSSRWKSTSKGAGKGPPVENQLSRLANRMPSTYQRISPNSHSMAKTWKSSLKVPLGRK